MKASFLRYLGFFFFLGRLLFCICNYFCNECIEILYCGDEANPLLTRSCCCLDVHLVVV